MQVCRDETEIYTDYQQIQPANNKLINAICTGTLDLPWLKFPIFSIPGLWLLVT